jgi:glycosyltransferase involved in cell wall biosynthesis
VVRLGIDAGSFARDRRGMGRVARAIAHAAVADPEIDATFLLQRAGDECALRAAIAGREITVRPAASAARAGAYDVVWLPWNGMRFAARAPVLLTIHDAFAFTCAPRGFIARSREQRPIRRGARHAARIVTVSGWSRDEIARELGVEPARIEVVHNAPDPMFFPDPSDVIMDGERYVLLVGVREPRKNARVVIEACARAFSNPADLLAIVGAVAPDDRRRLAGSGVRHLLLGDVDDRQLRALYRNARAVAVPSLAEGFGLVAVEAMACGAATLAADAAALPEATKGGALLLDPKDAGAWREAIDRTLHDDAFAAALAARGAERFDASARAAPAQDYLRLLRGVAGS